MTDILTSEQRSNLMASIKGKNTKPELLLRKLLWANGYRYRLHYKKLPGKPDIVFPGRKKAIFVHGCFWHGHKCSRGGKIPKANSEFWSKKLRGNMERDTKNQEALRTLGWDILIVWECDLKDPDKVIYSINRYLCK